MINAVLHLAEIEAGEQALAMEDVDPNGSPSRSGSSSLAERLLSDFSLKHGPAVGDYTVRALLGSLGSPEPWQSQD